MTEMVLRSANLGFPRIGTQRRLKTALERFWKGRIAESELLQVAREIQEEAWQWQREAGLTYVPVGDFSLYDHVLDTVELLGAVPDRYQNVSWSSSLERYFAMARGTSQHGGLPAMEMTKWFNTNYHYIVPEWKAGQTFQLQAASLFEQIERARAIGIRPRPVILGIMTLLSLGKQKSESTDLQAIYRALLPVYLELFRELAQRGVHEVQLDEPCLALDITPQQRQWITEALQEIAKAAPEVNVHLTSYFHGLADNLPWVAELPVDTIHLDLVADESAIDFVLSSWPEQRTVSLGLVNGRNVWTTDLQRALQLAERVVDVLGKDRVIISPSCSLLHSPLDVQAESSLDPEIRPWLAFAKQKLHEVALLSRAIQEGRAAVADELSENQRALTSRRNSQRVFAADVRQRAANVTPEMFSRNSPYEQRARQQQEQLQLPAFPTTTIGSFPQTREVRKARAAFRRQELSSNEYDQFLREKTCECVRWQDEIGLDVLVHGEFERNDMVEYFGEQLDGFLVTENGWVQSYGSRCVKPPIIFGDVSRRHPMTVFWSQFAQQQTTKPMKGMLTGPVTILFWSFVRDDLPRSEVCRQIALAIREEVDDLESAGLKVIQIDEPALREGLPLRKSEWDSYLQWAVDCFRLASSGVADETQIHTHMCYSEFNDIFTAIARLDADVISIETSRSQMELLQGFADFEYPNAIGPGVYDIHSPRTPTHQEVAELLQKAMEVVPHERLWVNPDCGLKTRQWEEVRPALQIMVDAAQEMRQAVGTQV